MLNRKLSTGFVAVTLIATSILTGCGSQSNPSTTVSSNVSDTNSTSTNSTASNSTASNSAQSSTPQNSLYKIGQTFKVGTLQYKVNSFKMSKTIGDVANGFGDTANGIYYIVNLTVKNLGTSTVSLDASMFGLVDIKNDQYSASNTATMDANSGPNDDLMLSQLNPGVSMTSNLVYDVPVNLPKGMQMGFSNPAGVYSGVNVELN